MAQLRKSQFGEELVRYLTASRQLSVAVSKLTAMSDEKVKTAEQELYSMFLLVFKYIFYIICVDFRLRGFLLQERMPPGRLRPSSTTG